MYSLYKAVTSQLIDVLASVNMTKPHMVASIQPRTLLPFGHVGTTWKKVSNTCLCLAIYMIINLACCWIISVVDLAHAACDQIMGTEMNQYLASVPNVDIIIYMILLVQYSVWIVMVSANA